MLYKFKQGHNTFEAIKNIYWAKGEGAANHSAVIRWFEKFCSVCKKLDTQAKSGWSKTEESKVMLQAIGTNLASRAQRAQHLTVQCGSISSQSQQKHPQLPNDTHKQNISKLLTRLCS